MQSSSQRCRHSEHFGSDELLLINIKYASMLLVFCLLSPFLFLISTFWPLIPKARRLTGPSDAGTFLSVRGEASRETVPVNVRTPQTKQFVTVSDCDKAQSPISLCLPAAGLDYRNVRRCFKFTFKIWTLIMPDIWQRISFLRALMWAVWAIIHSPFRSSVGEQVSREEVFSSP